MRLLKPLLFSTALLFSAPGCGEDKLTKEQARQAVQNQLDDNMRGVTYLIMDYCAEHPERANYQTLKEQGDYFRETGNKEPLEKAIADMIRADFDPRVSDLERLKKAIRTDSFALQAVEKGNYSAKRTHAGYDLIVNLPKKSSDSSQIKVYPYKPPASPSDYDDEDDY